MVEQHRPADGLNLRVDEDVRSGFVDLSALEGCRPCMAGEVEGLIQDPAEGKTVESAEQHFGVHR